MEEVFKELGFVMKAGAQTLIHPSGFKTLAVYEGGAFTMTLHEKNGGRYPFGDYVAGGQPDEIRTVVLFHKRYSEETVRRDAETDHRQMGARSEALAKAQRHHERHTSGGIIDPAEVIKTAEEFRNYVDKGVQEEI